MNSNISRSSAAPDLNVWEPREKGLGTEVTDDEELGPASAAGAPEAGSLSAEDQNEEVAGEGEDESAQQKGMLLMS